MSRILAVDTSSLEASLAIVEDGAARRVWAKSHDHPPSDRIFVTLEELFRDEGLQASDFDAFAACSGPGSFTGLRIGLSLAKSFAFALRRPVYAVDAVEMQALGIQTALGPNTPDRFWTVVQGYRDTTFCGLFRVLGEDLVREGALVWCEGDDQLAQQRPEGCPAYLPRHGRSVLQGALVAPEAPPAALVIAQRVAQRLARGEVPAFEDAQPLYLKPFNIGQKAKKPEDFRS
ncbi:MAG: tRNA (adenosine(37)-N6)-threonylcarbamoyltransferase complex dimerization subunit type 1 TsaB [Planctomycetes bacterium]|nr:tRNA (adenosine(37)-N6)-threonylcarbamoyltransferase complex dimerization subunit type 1 TsaB [Planctomycetota bacterium]